MKRGLTNQDFIKAAKLIGCEPAVIKAVCEVEAPAGGFDDKDRPVILFEPFKFGELTKHKFDGETVVINNHAYPLSLNHRLLPWSVKNAQYGPKSIQYDKLTAAERLDPDAAIKACSWGRFQILASNYKLCGFHSLDDFIRSMMTDEVSQLNAFIYFIKSVRLDDELQRKDFEGFAFGYNGPKQDKGTAIETDDYDYFLQQSYISQPDELKRRYESSKNQ